MSMNDEEEDLAKTAQMNSLELPLEALLSGTILLSGGRALDGTPIITCTQRGDGLSGDELKEKEALDLLLHYSTLPEEKDKLKGYTVIIDGPKLSQSAFTVISQAVAEFQVTLPGTVKSVIIVKPQAYDCNTVSGSKQIVSTSTCKVVYLDTSADLMKYVDQSNLTEELGGRMYYDHQQWVKYRLRVEPFMSDCKSISTHLSSVIENLSADLPPTFAEAEEALTLHQQKWTEIMKALHMTQLMNEGKRLIECMQEESSPLKDNPEYLNSLAKVQNLLIQIRDLKTKIEVLWSIQCTRLTDNFRFRKFEDEVQSTIGWFEEFADEYLAANKGSNYTVGDVLCMRDDVAVLENHVKYALERCEVQIKSAQEFQSMESYEVYWTQAKAMQCDLEERSSSFRRGLSELKDNIEKTLAINLTAHKLLDWCIEVTEILDKQSFEGLPTTSSEEVDGLLEEVDTLSSTPNVTKEEMEQLEQSADHCVSLEVQNSAQIALNRTREIQERIHLQKEKLRKTLEDLNTDAEKEELIKETKQVASALKDVLSSVSNQTQDGDDKQEVSPYPLSPTKMDSMQGSITVTPSHEVDKVLEDLETAVQKFQDNSEWLLITPESTGTPGAKEPDQPETPKTTLSEFIDSGKFKSMKPMIEIMQSEGLTVSVSGGDSDAQAKAENMSKKRKLIVRELVETEETYVRDLEHIINGYVREFDDAMNAITDPSMSESRSLPGTLVGRRHTLFCNIERLLEFTRDVFLPELSKLEKSPMRLGTVFCSYEDGLMQYAPYFKNIPAQEDIMQESGAKFFAETQKRIADPFNLSSYLLKPFQRMTRYALFLKEMIKNTPKTIKGTVIENLRRAQKQVEFILRHGNDLLAVDNLQGVEGGIKQFGRIRRQGDLVHVEGMISKKEKRVFLFEHAVVVAKKGKAPKGSLMSEVFSSKIHLRLNELSMREDLSDHPLRFELTDHKKTKYTFQCSAREEKEEWIADLRDLFLDQMLVLKEQSQQNFVYFTSKDTQEPIYGYTARTTGKGALRTKSFRQPSRTSGASGPKRLSELTPPHMSLPGNSEDISQSSPSRSSKMSGSSGEHVYEELPGVRKTAPQTVRPPLPPRKTPETSEYEEIPPRPSKPNQQD